MAGPWEAYQSEGRSEGPWSAYANFDERFKGEGTAPAPTQKLQDAMRARQSPRERGRSIAMERATPVDSAILGAVDAASGNLTDYPPALVAGVRSAIRGEGFSKGYGDQLEELRGQAEGAKEKNPGSTIGGLLTGAVTTGIGPQMFVKAPTVLGRILQSALVGGGVGGGQGLASGEGVEDRLNQGAKGAAIGTVIGAGGEAVISGVGKGIQKYVGAASEPAPGVVPANRIAAAAEFNVPLSRGQATGNIDQQAFEEAARHGARGRLAGGAVRGFDDEQAKAITAAKQGVSDTLGGTAAPIPETGGAVAGALRERAAGLRNQSSSFYESAAAKDASIASDEITKLGQKVAAQLESEGVRLDTYGNYPGAQAAMNLLRRVSGFEGASADGKVVAQSLDGLEQARKGLLKVKPANGEDARALKAIRNSFDDWIDDAIDKKLFSGDATALDDLKQARALWSQYKGITANKTNDATKIVSKMATEERTGEEAANWLLGTVGAGQAGRSARIAAEIKKHIGADSQEWEALRQAAWTKAINPTQGQGGNQAVSKSIVNFVNGEGAPLARQLFTPEEIGLMNRLAGVMRQTVTDARATNPSKSSYGIARLIGAGGVSGSGAAGYWMSGDPAFLAMAAAPLFRSGSSLMKGVAATRPQPSAIATGTGPASRVGLVATEDVQASR